MKTVFHPSEKRGHADHGWLNAYHSFSFASWYDPEKIHFGMLRVLNDDTVAPGMGFGKHPHDNMEIVTIPLAGQLEHKDSMGNGSVIKAGQIQVMSAGSGVFHSEFNPSPTEEVRLLQIWVFPHTKNVDPRYGEMKYELKNGTFTTVVDPDKTKTGTMWLHQDAWFYIAVTDKEMELPYSINKKGNGVYLFLLEGTATIAGSTLNRRDAIGVSETDKVEIRLGENSKLLAIEVPMN